jgi:hypothetical protein
MLSKSGVKLKIPRRDAPSMPTAMQEVDNASMISNNEDIPTAMSKVSKPAVKRKQSTRKPHGSKKTPTA